MDVPRVADWRWRWRLLCGVPQDLMNWISAVGKTGGRGGVSLLDLRISASRPHLIRANAYIDVAASFEA